MTKKLGQDYADFLKEAKEIPEVREYLNSFSVIIGDLVMSRRIQLGWSQKELADAAGTTQARISQIEAAHEGIKMGTINKVFRVLGLAQINPDYREEATGLELARA